MASPLVIKCSEYIAAKNWTIAFAESCTAGRLYYEFALAPKSNQILLGGIVSYDATFKENVLNVPHDLIDKYTPESSEVTQAMANNFCQFSGSDICVAITGLLKPGGSETEEKPVGTIFIHIIFPHKQVARRVVFDGTPEERASKAIEEVALIIMEEIGIPESL